MYFRILGFKRILKASKGERQGLHEGMFSEWHLDFLVATLDVRRLKARPSNLRGKINSNLEYCIQTIQSSMGLK